MAEPWHRDIDHIMIKEPPRDLTFLFERYTEYQHGTSHAHQVKALFAWPLSLRPKRGP